MRQELIKLLNHREKSRRHVGEGSSTTPTPTPRKSLFAALAPLSFGGGDGPQLASS